MAEPPRILHVCKSPPSPSGVALYAKAFKEVLFELGNVKTVQAPAIPEDSQAIRAVLSGLSRGWKARAENLKLVHVELSGRALFEFYFTCAYVFGNPASRLVVTCHDSPHIVGPALLFRELDRKGYRRLATLLSRTAGARLEALVMTRARLVLALTEEGAASLGSRWERDAFTIPHVVDSPEHVAKENVVFMPGYVGEESPVVAVAQAMKIINHVHALDWQLVVGNCAAEVVEKVRESGLREPTVRFVGYLPEGDLLNTFASARIVLRLLGGAQGANVYAASGPLAWAIARGCLCITDDRRAGARELADLSFIVLTDAPIEALKEAMVGWPSNVPENISERAQQRFGASCIAQQYRSLLHAHLD